jgi:hypothetical protein
VSKAKRLVASEIIERLIFIANGHSVILDKDLAQLYGVSTGQLNKAVTRNLERFPPDFMFRLNVKESRNLIFQNGTSSWGGTRKPPRVFTEQGVAMLSSVVRSKTAVRVNVEIMRAFVRMRKFLATHKKLADKIFRIGKKLDKHEKYFALLFDLITRLMSKPAKKPRQIGFAADRK